MAPRVATQGGSTFHITMFSIWNIAFDVAVMRLVSSAGAAVGEIGRAVAGEMAKQFGAHVACDRDESLAGDPAGKTPEQIIRRDKGDNEDESGPGLDDAGAFCAMASTSRLTPYCVLIEQITALKTASNMMACAAGLRPT